MRSTDGSRSAAHPHFRVITQYLNRAILKLSLSGFHEVSGSNSHNLYCLITRLNKRFAEAAPAVLQSTISLLEAGQGLSVR